MSPFHDRTRREVLAAAGWISGLPLAGCVASPDAGGSQSGAPEHTVTPATTTARTTTPMPTIEPPTPAATRPDGPKPYPPSPDPLDAAAAKEAAYAYEGAWIANRLADEPCVESYTLAATVTDPEREVLRRGRSAMLVRIRHPYAFSAEREDGQLHADLSTEARYYVSTEAVVRVAGDDVTAPCE